MEQLTCTVTKFILGSFFLICAGVMSFYMVIPKSRGSIWLWQMKVLSVSKDNDVPGSNYWELLINNDSKLTDWKTAASANASVMMIKGEKKSYHIGDVIKVDIILKDFAGKRKVRGGDNVRLWIKDTTSDAYAAGSVVDNGNGTYEGTLVLLWAGNVTITATVATPREIIKLLYQNVRLGRNAVPMKGRFKRGNITEDTICSPLVKVGSCNRTSMNSDLPWYCEKPKRLKCGDYLYHTAFSGPCNYFSKQEILLIKSMNKNTRLPIIALAVHSSGSQLVQNHYGNGLDLIPCNRLPPHITWKVNSPRGYLYKGQWHPKYCKSAFAGSKGAYKKCLRGKSLWFFGDSTLRQFFEHFGALLDSQLTTEPWSGKWHKPSRGVNRSLNISMFWAIHALPVYNYASFDDPTVNYKGPNVYIDKIPRNSQGFVVIHFGLHFIASPPHILRQHVRKTVQSVRSLKKRAKEMKVFVKGSISFFNLDEHSMFSDFWGGVYDRILKKEFAPLMEEVFFLDMMDITVAKENKDRHPLKEILTPVINHMMSFMCP